MVDWIVELLTWPIRPLHLPRQICRTLRLWGATFRGIFGRNCRVTRQPTSIILMWWGRRVVCRRWLIAAPLSLPIILQSQSHRINRANLKRMKQSTTLALTQPLTQTLTPALAFVPTLSLIPTLALVSRQFLLVSWRRATPSPEPSPTTTNDAMTPSAAAAINDTWTISR